MAVAGGAGDGEGVGPVASVQMSHEKKLRMLRRGLAASSPCFRVKGIV